MKTIKPIDQASDAQLRELCSRFRNTTDLRNIIQSSLPMLSFERMQLVNFLKHNHIWAFAQ